MKITCIVVTEYIPWDEAVQFAESQHNKFRAYLHKYPRTHAGEHRYAVVRRPALFELPLESHSITAKANTLFAVDGGDVTDRLYALQQAQIREEIEAVKRSAERYDVTPQALQIRAGLKAKCGGRV